jgi:hypothetical protein
MLVLAGGCDLHDARPGLPGVAHALTSQNTPAFSVLPRGQSGNQ